VQRARPTNIGKSVLRTKSGSARCRWLLVWVGFVFSPMYSAGRHRTKQPQRKRNNDVYTRLRQDSILHERGATAVRPGVSSGPKRLPTCWTTAGAHLGRGAGVFFSRRHTTPGDTEPNDTMSGGLKRPQAAGVEPTGVDHSVRVIPRANQTTIPMQSNGFLCFLLGGASTVLGRFPAHPGLWGVWETPRPGPRSICTDLQPGRPLQREFREVF
jgi:hypothetical protein